ncbi:MAG: hypothetical protein IJW51_07015 [Clostridia bacterium]|nr:hypothetical protein [Clostridia bacterium]
MQKKTSQKGYGVTLAGIVVLALAVIIIFLTIFVPYTRENRMFYDRVEQLRFGGYEEALLIDPLFKTDDPLASRGKEVLLRAQDVTALREKLAVVVRAGFHNTENRKMLSGAWDLKWQLRAADGTRAELYFTENEIYFYADGTAFCFTPKDAVVYDTLYTLMQQLLSNG